MFRGFPGNLAVLFVLFFLTSGCAAFRPALPPATSDVFVLLPDEMGKTGAIVVSGAGGKQVLSEPRQAVAVAPGAPPSEPFVMQERQVRALAGPALEALPHSPLKFILFFRHDTTELTEESMGKLREVVRAIKDRGPVDISVVGHTDTVGTRKYHNQLSFERARAVTALLTAEGVDPAILAIAFHGKDNLLVPTGDQVPEPRNRRVEVTVR
ncbi:MAG TPA: OmpA family protein [Candidatus Deferrimicrobiaceae bacterium]|nr:OmpA family protein [Candidatus Deferrimicrobiaceae bacterium]